MINSFLRGIVAFKENAGFVVLGENLNYNSPYDE